MPVWRRVETREFLSLYEVLVKRHVDTLQELHAQRPPKRVAAEVRDLQSELHDVLQGIFLLRHCSPRAQDLTASFGERLSALTLASFLHRTRPARFVDARTVVVTDDGFTHAGVIFSKPMLPSRSTLPVSMPDPAEACCPW